MVTALPMDSALWRQLSAMVNQLPGENRAAMIQTIAAMSLPDRWSRWLQASALSYLTHDWHWVAQQVAQVDDSIPPDAIMNFVQLSWYRALIAAPDHEVFCRMLRSAEIHTLVSRVAAGIPVQSVERSKQQSKVAVYTTQLINRQHAGTDMTLQLASLLSACGFETHIFAAQEQEIPHGRSLHGGNENVGFSNIDITMFRDASLRQVKASIGDAKFTLIHRYNNITNSLQKYSPDFIVFIGFFSPVISALYKEYPIIGLSVHAIPPLSPVDVWLCANPEKTAALAGPAPNILKRFPYRFRSRGIATPIDRAKIGVPDNAVLMVTAGLRLSSEVMPPWSDQILVLLNKWTNVHWLLIGQPAEQPLSGVPSHPRIHVIPPVETLESWLAMANIYVNPSRLGGGASVAMAMEQGLAVAALRGGDGGDKVGELALDGLQNFFQKLEEWLREPELARKIGDALRYRFQTSLDMSSNEARAGIMDAYCLALKNFSDRHKE